MIDLLLIVLLFAFVPVGIILLFMGCFYCFIFLQYCITYSDDEGNEDINARQEGVLEGTPTSTTTVTIVSEPNSNNAIIGRSRSRDSSPWGKRLGPAGFVFPPPPSPPPVESTSEELPPPPYHTICFIQPEKPSDNKDSSTAHHNATL